MIEFIEDCDVPLGETVEYRGPHSRETTNETKETSVKTLNVLARVEPSLVASVLSDWIDSRPNVPR